MADRDPRPLIVTVTPNPSLDLLFEAQRLVWDDANRMDEPRRRPGGQGINVARAVTVLGGRSLAVALLGGSTGDHIAAVLASEGTPLRHVHCRDETRTFVAVRELQTGHNLLLNARGPRRSADDASRMEAEVRATLDALRPAWLACCGSVPPGFPADFYARLATAARRAGAQVVVDCDGEPLRLAVEAGCDLLVPNQHEAERLAGTAVRDLGEAEDVAASLRAAGTPLVCITLGATGAVLATEAGCWRASPPQMAGGSAVGAGDAFLAGLLMARLRSDAPETALRYAVATSAATLRSTGASLITAADVMDLLPAVNGSQSARPGGGGSS
jgi:1-phosphofructokinase family hexose kinase